MPQSYAASVQGALIRATRLATTGAPATGATASYVTTAFTRVSFTPEFEEGDEITEKNASGGVCVTYKAPDTLKRVTLELAICEPDPELTELIAGGTILTDGATPPNSIGYAAPATGVDPNPNGASLEVWSYAIANGKRDGTLPYFHWVFPYVKLRQGGDRVFENGLLANTFEGYGVGNTAWGDGPAGDWTHTTERAYQYARKATMPGTTAGYVAVV